MIERIYKTFTGDYIDLENVFAIGEIEFWQEISDSVTIFIPVQISNCLRKLKLKLNGNKNVTSVSGEKIGRCVYFNKNGKIKKETKEYYTKRHEGFVNAWKQYKKENTRACLKEKERNEAIANSHHTDF